MLLVLSLSLVGCSTANSFGEKGSCKAEVLFECECDCSNKSAIEAVSDIVQ